MDAIATWIPTRASLRAGLCAAVLAACVLASGCSSVQTHPAAPAPAAANSTIAQAAALARDNASLGGAARRDNEARIDQLLAGLDNATLAREAAALAVGDPLYNFAGRALLNRGLALPRPFDHGDWRAQAGKRPPADSDGYRPPMKLGVLLPLSGDLS
jgi:outer membrane PBP1 activator LpoA protein